MNENNLIEKMNTFLKSTWKVILGILITLLVQGALSFGKNTLDRFFNINSYVNIGNDVNSSPNMYAVITVLGLFASIFYISGIYKLVKKDKIIFATVDVFIFLFMIFVTVSVMVRANSIVKANNLNKNIEIIHPYISERKYIRLKSDLYQIDSKTSYDNLDKDIRNVAKENNANIN